MQALMKEWCCVKLTRMPGGATENLSLLRSFMVIGGHPQCYKGYAPPELKTPVIWILA